ncbi:DEAD/DEAH box helicase family protein [Fructilactobacillus hinvesii]|uniref:DEAD/DEAH box helicase family protein n=1 Tax=Fructilactobacillus hinvesii TaxID=2940300 RepID=A0ABY5BSG4_9LACO|nr:helicase-related protein [Fructilactobacillus hinvesii]USS87809.1 DEAD/DEAH box helicase family protein [Fructilactobacillus hinvesii]
MNEQSFWGRLVPLAPSTVRALELPTPIQTSPAVEIQKVSLHCNRCQTDCEKEQQRLPSGDYYCRACLNLGRLDTGLQLVSLSEPNAFIPVEDSLQWSGHLTPQQQSCANQVQRAFQNQEHLLLWAVTGAGKTEISFPGVAWALNHGLRVAIAAPRVDVCGELYPRYQAVFPTVPIALLHGHSDTGYGYRQLTICTTHQLLRFQAAFDVLILDEVDAFPYADNPMLEQAAQRALKPHGAWLLMTATPSVRLQREYRGRIAYLPRRFHGHPLPQIQWRIAFRWRQQLERGQLPRRLRRLLWIKIHNQQPFLLFVPRIRDLAVVDRYLQRHFRAACRWETVHAGDSERIRKVEQMRQRTVLFLVTTTILERGVTFPGIDVIILGGDDRVFSVASLVQMAGRVGRKATCPTGHVDCIVSGYTKNVRKARQQIAHMNRRGATDV